jgi:hypothetical protein
MAGLIVQEEIGAVLEGARACAALHCKVREMLIAEEALDALLLLLHVFNEIGKSLNFELEIVNELRVNRAWDHGSVGTGRSMLQIMRRLGNQINGLGQNGFVLQIFGLPVCGADCTGLLVPGEMRSATLKTTVT